MWNELKNKNEKLKKEKEDLKNNYITPKEKTSKNEEEDVILKEDYDNIIDEKN